MRTAIAPPVERRPDVILGPLGRVWLDWADAKRRGQQVRARVLEAAHRELKAGAR